MQLQQEKLVAISYLLRKCGLLAHTSAAFLKNCCTEKLFICASHLHLQKAASPDKEKAVSNAILFDAVRNPFQLFPVPILPFSLTFGWCHFSEVYR